MIFGKKHQKQKINKYQSKIELLERIRCFKQTKDTKLQ